MEIQKFISCTGFSSPDWVINTLLELEVDIVFSRNIMERNSAVRTQIPTFGVPLWTWTTKSV